MALLHSFEKSGNFLFRNRSFLPLVLFILSVPVIYYTDHYTLSDEAYCVITIIAIVISASGFIIRAISIATTPKGTSGRNTKSGQVAESLNTTGIYSLVRHPLYLGNYLMWIGIVIFTFNIYFVITVSLAFWLYYERIMFAEERFLEKKFGDKYMYWSLKVPAFIPSFKNYIPNQVLFSWKSILRREYSGFLATVLSFAFIDHLRHWFILQDVNWNRPSTMVLGAALIVTLLLRTLKHHTSVLKEKDRS